MNEHAATHLKEDEESTDVEDEIKKMMNQTVRSSSQKVTVEIEKEIDNTVSLLKQLSIQYDELQSLLVSIPKDSAEAFPIDVVASFVRASQISPSLVKMLSSLSEETKTLRRESAKTSAQLKDAVVKMHEVSQKSQSEQLERKFLENTVKDATLELKASRDAMATLRKKLIELEAALDAQKKINKELLMSKKITLKERDVHEEEKKILRALIEEKDSAFHGLSLKLEQEEFEKKRLKRDLDVLRIQFLRLQKRAELKDTALETCNREMERMIKQLEHLSKMDTEKKEKLQYLKIIKKRLETENRHLLSLGGSSDTVKGRSLAAVNGRSTATADLGAQDVSHHMANQYTQKNTSYKKNPKNQSRNGSEPEKTYELEEISQDSAEPANAAEREIEDRDAQNVPSSFRNAVSSSVPSESDSADKTATSFREMQKKTEEMSKKFKELEILLQEIKRGTNGQQ